ncbi:hypothetical protein HGRIS_006220 [Hohenbuehelia grisea]|uniref:Zinc finger protein n=1 Tax=Hohenbuehelia grisea TaxID=104357 RepID=A0ABR3K1X7_9AGAR
MATPLLAMMPTALASRHSVDIKANGEVSRMRSHRGNMPSLPQTKYCSLCPAKFTRTTHLNRHLRSHTNERSHRCNICNAEFTRSDLLTRHKRTCGDSQNANKSRRKSCQACAESKIKCDLLFPCTKCSTRGRECVFINDPETSRNKKLAAQKRAAHRANASRSPQEKAGSIGAMTPGATSLPNLSPTPSQLFSGFPTPSHGSAALPLPYPILSSSTSSFTGYDSSPFSSSSGSSSASSSSSPRSEFFDNQQDILTNFDLGFDSLTLDSHLNRLFSSNMFEPFLDQSFPSCSPQSSHPVISGDFAWPEDQDFYSSYTNIASDGFAFPDSIASEAHFTTNLDYPSGLLPNTSPPTTTVPDLSIPGAVPCSTDVDSSATDSRALPTPAELQHYLYLFFTAFSAQVPVLHPSTWRMEGKPPILIRTMQACGALFVKTRVALNFINDTLSSTRDILLQDFARNSTDNAEQINLIIAVVLLQTIGLFHQRADQRVSSNVYHGMLVMMIRRTGIISRVASWTSGDLNDPNSLDSVWREWTTYESIKRALLLTYLHDCCHCMYFSLAPSFQTSEFDINLPCDEAVWKAADAREWLEVVRSTSPYGIGHPRFMGVNMQHALASLVDKQPSTAPLALNPFAHFVLIHSILRDIYAFRAENQVAESSGSAFIPAWNAHGSTESAKETLRPSQFALQNWLRSWLNGPETMLLEKGRDEPPFISNALPFYWLAQVSLLATQEGTAPLGLKALGAKAEGRFHLMKQWLDKIRSFLRRGDQIPAHLWDELMKIHGDASQAETRTTVVVDVDGQNGLLAFFPENGL